ncbi:MAG: uracil-DNA glycosylase family protein [Planctomycetota bacterium]
MSCRRVASGPMERGDFDSLLRDVRSCRLCEDALEDGVRPVVQLSPAARILIAGQAPGRRVHESGIPFDDPSGDRLREWMGVDRDTFYDPSQIAILPMGFCYPGTGKSGDLPPRTECAPAWREALLDALVDVRLTLVIGQYAARWHLDVGRQSLKVTVRDWKNTRPAIIPLPHPSPRNNIWLKKNPWFGEEVLPYLRRASQRALKQ